MMSGGHKVDIGGEGSNYKYMRNIPESEFLPVQWSIRDLVNIWGLA